MWRSNNPGCDGRLFGGRCVASRSVPRDYGTAGPLAVVSARVTASPAPRTHRALLVTFYGCNRRCHRRPFYPHAPIYSGVWIRAKSSLSLSAVAVGHTRHRKNVAVCKHPLRINTRSVEIPYGSRVRALSRLVSWIGRFEFGRAHGRTAARRSAAPRFVRARSVAIAVVFLQLHHKHLSDTHTHTHITPAGEQYTRTHVIRHTDTVRVRTVVDGISVRTIARFRSYV